MDASQWPQGIGVVKEQSESSRLEKKPRPLKEHALNCPRCSSTNTKFCYYNNYSLSQPRYFCKTCRRYWTEGGSLRNVPVGGGSRKNKRTCTSSKFSTPNLSPQNSKIHDGKALNFSYSSSHFGGLSHQFPSFPFLDPQNPNIPSSSSSQLPVMELLKTGTSSVYDHSSNSSAGFLVNGFKPSLSFSLDGLDQDGYGNLQGVQDPRNSSRILFPFGELKPDSTGEQFEQNRGQGEANGYWNGMLAGGSW